MNVIACQTQTTNGQGQMPFTKIFCKMIEPVAAVAVQGFTIRRKSQPTVPDVPDAQRYSLRPSFLPALGAHVLQSNIHAVVTAMHAVAAVAVNCHCLPPPDCQRPSSARLAATPNTTSARLAAPTGIECHCKRVLIPLSLSLEVQISRGASLSRYLHSDYLPFRWRKLPHWPLALLILRKIPV